MLGHESLDDFDDLLLLASRQPGNGIEHKTGFSGGAAVPMLPRWLAEQILDGYFEHIGEGGQLFRAQRRGASLPVGNDLLIYTQGIRYLLLRKSGAFPECGDTLSEWRSLMFRRSSCLHVRIIPRRRKSY